MNLKKSNELTGEHLNAASGGAKKLNEMSDNSKEYIKMVTKMAKTFNANKNEIGSRKKNIINAYSALEADDTDDDDFEDDE